MEMLLTYALDYFNCERMEKKKRNKKKEKKGENKKERGIKGKRK